MGLAATEPLPVSGSPTLWGGRQNQKWPTSGPGAYISHVAYGVPGASGGEGEKMRSGPQTGRMAT